jgi:hypothetical protein
MAVILATQEAEIRRIVVWNQPRQIVCQALSWKENLHKAGRVAQGVGPEFKPYKKNLKELEKKKNKLGPKSEEGRKYQRSE